MDRSGEGEPHVHAARVFLDRALDELSDLGKCFNRWHRLIDLRFAEPHDLPVQVNVLPAGKLGIESRSELEQRRNAPACDHASCSRLKNAADDLKEGALATAVRPD